MILSQIYNMDYYDAFKLLPDNCLDLIVTDPPDPTQKPLNLIELLTNWYCLKEGFN